MSYNIGLILPDKSNNILDEVKVKFNNHANMNYNHLERVLNKDEHVYYWCGTNSETGFNTYDSCKRIEEKKDNIEERDERYKEVFFRSTYPLIELRKKDAEKWIDIIRTFFNEYGMKRIGIVMFWMSNDIDENDFTTFPSDEIHLDDLNIDVILKFKPEIIHYIVK